MNEAGTLATSVDHSMTGTQARIREMLEPLKQECSLIEYMHLLNDMLKLDQQIRDLELFYGNVYADVISLEKRLTKIKNI